VWIRGRADIYRAAHQEVEILGKRIGPLIGDANRSAIRIDTTVGVGLRRVTRIEELDATQAYISARMTASMRCR